MIVIITGVLLFKNIVLWLYTSDPLPEKLDVICTYAGNPKREIWAFGLYEKYKPKWVVSTWYRKKILGWAQQKSVDEKDLITTAS